MEAKGAVSISTVQTRPVVVVYVLFESRPLVGFTPIRKRRRFEYDRGHSTEVGASPNEKVYVFIALSAGVIGVLLAGSIILALLGFGDDDRRPSQPASVAQPYVDPAHRFRMTIPAGCRVDRQDDAATTFRCGTTWPSAPITYSYATVAFRSGGTRQSDLQLLVNRLVAGWHDLKLLKNDRKAKLHGRPRE